MITIAYLWFAVGWLLGLSVKTSREFMLSICVEKLNLVLLFLQRFPLLLLKRQLFLNILCEVFVSKQSRWNVFLLRIHFVEITEIIIVVGLFAIT